MKKGLIIILVIIGALLVWGLVGGAEAQSVGVTCDIGVGATFCWQWHTNAIGQAGEFFENLGG